MLRAGLIGCGLIVRRSHLPAMKTLRSKIRLAAVADLREEAGQEVAEQYEIGAVDVYTDYRKLLNRDDIDFVVVATPEYAHHEQVTEAARNGKHVLCEKPIALTVDEADSMLEACRRAGVQLMVGHSRRWTRRYQEAARAIEEGLIGDVRLIRENERRSQAQVAESGQWTPDGRAHWGTFANYSAGLALTTSIHEADLFSFFSNQRPVRVYGEQRITPPDSEVPDFLSFIVELDGGAVAGAELSNTVPAKYPAYHQLEIYGTNGMLRSKDTDSWTLMQFGEESARFPMKYETLLHFQDAYVGQLSAFADALIADETVPLSPESARDALAVSLAALKSARQGKAVELSQ